MLLDFCYSFLLIIQNASPFRNNYIDPQIAEFLSLVVQMFGPQPRIF